MWYKPIYLHFLPLYLFFSSYFYNFLLQLLFFFFLSIHYYITHLCHSTISLSLLYEDIKHISQGTHTHDQANMNYKGDNCFWKRRLLTTFCHEKIFFRGSKRPFMTNNNSIELQYNDVSGSNNNNVFSCPYLLFFFCWIFNYIWPANLNIIYFLKCV